MEKKHTRGSFTGSIGFVLAAAGSAVGLGNIWRFPYLAAKDGGGTFILVYIVLALTFGFTLLTTDIAIGRKPDKVRLSLTVKFTRLERSWPSRQYRAGCHPALLLLHWRLGIKISVCVSHRTWHCCCRGWLLYRLYYRYMAADCVVGNLSFSYRIRCISWCQ